MHSEGSTECIGSPDVFTVCVHINVPVRTQSSMQRGLCGCVHRGAGALPLWGGEGHGAKMSRESGNGPVWIIKRDGRARPPACNSNKMLPLAEPSRCNVAMRAGYRSREEATEARYGERKSKPTLPSINPCDGSIDSLCLCVYPGMYLSVCTYEKGSTEVSMCVAPLICLEEWVAISGRSRQACTHMCSDFHTRLRGILWCDVIFLPW